MSDNTRERVLVFGDDLRIFLTVVRSLGRAGKEVHAAPFNWHSPALKSRYIAAVHRLPRCSDDPLAWCASVHQLLRETRFDLVLPYCDDRAILAFHMHREQFADFRVALPTADNIDLLFDKGRTRQLCAELDVPVSPGARLAADDTADTLVTRFGLPLVLKPRRSYWTDKLDAWGKVHIVDNKSELDNILSSITEPDRYLVEGYFDGHGVGVSVLAEDGAIQHAFQHRRLREGRGGSSSFRISEPVDHALYRVCEKICQRTHLTGVCMFEFRRNPLTQEHVLLETNARFWGSSGLPLALGVDFPLYLYDLLVHERRHKPVSYAAGVRSRNTVLDAFNLLANLRRLRRGQFGDWVKEFGLFLAQPVGWLTRRERSDTFVLDDLRPALWECATLGKSLAQKRDRDRVRELNRRRRVRSVAT